MDLDQVINDVTAVQTALTQLQSDLQLLANTPTPAPAPGDPVWTAVESALTANGWTAPVAPELPEGTVEDTTDTSAEA